MNTQKNTNKSQATKAFLETERLLLREMTQNDFCALYAVLSDSETMRFYPHPFDEAQVKRWIDNNIERYAVFGFGLWAVVLKSSGEVIGDCGITMQSINGLIKPEIGYHIRKDLQRRGYAKEAASACRDWAFTYTPFRTLYSYMKKANTASRATAESIGMSFAFEYTDESSQAVAVYAVNR